MVSFVLIISFLLHIITLTAIYQLVKQIQSLKQENSNDIMELFETYLQEIKEENNRLQEEISRKVVDEKLEESQLSADFDTKPTSIVTNKSLNEYMPPESDTEDIVEASLQARILKLHSEGYTETEIAQKLNCGKTEAALIIKLHAKK